jgi:uncharacterized membrane protein YfhO
LLILTDAYYPGWQAIINDVPATIHRVDGMFRGIFVPAGENEVVFSFASSAFKTGRVITVLAILIWVALAVGERVVDRRS